MKYYIEGELEKQLTEQLSLPADENGMPPVFIINSVTGTGVTPRVNNWAKESGVDYLRVVTPLLSMRSPESENEPPYIFTEEEIAIIDKPNRVLFLDDFDWADAPVRKELVKLITQASLTDKRAPHHLHRLQGLRLLLVRIHPESDPSQYSEEEKKALGL